jgi:glutathione S-transferase
MITVHHLAASRSRRIVWLLEELGVEYQIERYARDPGSGRASEAYRRLHPLGKAPVISDGDLVLAESGAIVELLVERYGEGRLAPPPGDPLRARYLYWMHFAEGTLMATFVTQIVLGMAGDGAEKVRERVQGEVRRNFAFVERELGAGPWLLGAGFSAADVMVGYVADIADRRDELADLNELRGYVARLRERPAFRRAAAAVGEDK